MFCLSRKGIVLFFLLWVKFFQPSEVSAQTDDETMAHEYMKNGEFDKATVLFEKIYEKKQTDDIYSGYLQCLLAEKENDQAEKLVKKQIKRFPKQLTYIVDLGFVYKSGNHSDKAKEQFNKAIQQLTPDQFVVTSVANALISKYEPDLAIEAYLQGRKLMRRGFNMELAELYYQKSENLKMINEYLDALTGEDNLQTVENLLQSKLGNDPEGTKMDLLRNELLKRIQHSAEERMYSEMLIWLFIQQRDFDSALIQSKALDKRLGEDGGRLILIADLATANEAYDVAVKAYQYVVAKGVNSSYYSTARINLLNTLNKKITSEGNYTQKDLEDLEKDYADAITELGKSAQTAPLVHGLAHLQAFYMGKIAEAEQEMTDLLNIPNIKPQFEGECKLELGDIYLLEGKVWESTLLYSQVDLDFKHSPLGQEAKFRNAKWSYYKGDFEWAQSQLDILKSATTELMANDAMSLSLLISDNLAFDSTTTALSMFSRADLLMYQNKNDEADLTLDSLLKMFHTHSLADDAIFKKAAIMKKRRKFAEANVYLQMVVDSFPESILADDAMFQLGDIYQYKLKDNKRAMEYYQQLLLKHPGSLFCVEARKRYRILRGDSVN